MFTSSENVIADTLRAMSDGEISLGLFEENVDDVGATALANALKENTSLQELDLRNNQFGDDGVIALANALKENTSLQKLDLGNNQVGGDGAAALANSLKENALLQMLYLQLNEIGDDGATALANALKENKSLQEIDLRHNQVGSDGATALANALKENASLQRLDLRLNKIRDTGATALANALKENKSLQELDIEYNHVGDNGATALANSLKENASLQMLYLKGNRVGDDGTTALANALKVNASLHLLRLQFNRVGVDGATALANALKENTSLKELNLGANQVGDDGATLLAFALYENKSLQELTLWSNQIGYNGATALACALKENTSLQVLIVRDNQVGDNGAAALAIALKVNASLQLLNVTANIIGDDGATALANALKKNKSLQSLNLGANLIGDDGATELANALKKNKSLQSLNLGANLIGDDGATELANALKENKSLQSLHLTWNQIGNNGATALANALKENTSLQKLTLHGNNVSKDRLGEIIEVLRKNRDERLRREEHAQIVEERKRIVEEHAKFVEERAKKQQAEIEALKELDRSGDGIGPQGAKEMTESLAKYTQLHSLNLSKNGIGDSGAEAVACALAEHKSLQNLNLGADEIGPIGAKAVADMLEKNESLLTLNLGWNRISDGGAAAMAKSLAANTTLCSLDLQKNGISADGAKEIAEAFVKSQMLELLNLGWNAIGDDGAVYVAKALEENKSLLFLDIARNKIGSVGAAAVAGALLKNKSLHTLKFRSNDITEDGAEQLANALAKSESLQALDLAKNRVGLAGARSLAGALTENTTLHFLDISDNNIGDDGASALAGALARIMSLVTLHLQNNAIGDVGANEIAKALAANNSLQSLNLSENLIGPNGAGTMAGALVKNSTLEELDLGDNNLEDEGAKKLAKALEQNKSSLQSLDLTGSRVGNGGVEALAVALESNDILQELALGHVPHASPDILKRIGSRLKLVKDELNELSETAAQALKTDQKVRWGRAKLMVVGKAAAGKTSTIRTLLGQPFVPEHISTIGIDLMLMHTRDWKERKDTGDADLGEQFAKHKYRNIAKHDELDQSEAQSSKDAARSLSKAPRAAPPAISASSASAARPPPPQSPSVQFDEEVIAKAVSTPLRIRVKEQAGKEKEEISFTIWDYGGQEVFYALHHLFLTQYGVYVVVFDMREMLGKERFKEKLDEEDLAKLASQDDAIQTLRFWLDSIRLHASGVEVALVGTFLDQVPELDQHHEIQEILERKIFRELKGDPKIQRSIWQGEFLQFFPINNQDREDVDGRVAHLKDQLTRSVADKAFVKKKVPLRWSYCLDQLLQQSDQYMQFDDVEALAVTKCFVAKKDVRKMLEYLHELGVVLYFSKNEALCKVVVIQPQWLLKNLSRVICDPSAKHMRSHMNKLRSGAGERTALPAHLDSALYQWRDNAVASRALLEFLWEGNPVDFLVSLMESTLLACPSPWVSDDAGKKDTVLVPSLLPAASEQDKKDGRRWVGDSALAYVDFELLPKGFFQRLVALLFQEFQGVATVGEKVFADVARVDFHGMSCLMEVSQRRITFRFGNARRGRPLASLLALLSKELNEIDETFMMGKLGPKLYVSSDGTDNDKFCALAESLANPLEGNTIQTRSSCQPLEDFASFVNGTSQAQMLRESQARGNSESVAGAEYQYDAFLSHAWGPANTSHDKVKVVERKLAGLGIRCWIDANDIGADIFWSIADGMEKSRTTVIFVTREYMEKVNTKLSTDEFCRMEFYYAMNRQKPVRVIPCVLDKDMADSSEWKGPFLFRWSGNPLFVPMYSEVEPTDAEIAELAQRIKVTISQNQL